MFLPATVLSNVLPSMQIFRQEIFGPAAPLYCFNDEAALIKMANDTEYGLSTYVYTKDMAKALRLTKAIESGMVRVNTMFGHDLLPFGGVKQSGIGREGGLEGVDAYCEIKSVAMQF